MPLIKSFPIISNFTISWRHGLPIFLLGTLLSCSRSRDVISTPILFDQHRKELSLQYLSDRYGLQREIPSINPSMVVIHHTVIPTMQRTFQAFYPAELPGSRQELQGAGALNVSAHYLVDRDGTIYNLMPDTLMARHVIGLNHCAIGVENVGGTEDMPLTEEQLKANIWLVKKLKDKYDIEFLIGHDEYQLFEGHVIWLERDKGYRTIKTDPGKNFMEKLRGAMKNGTFKPLPIRYSDD